MATIHEVVFKNRDRHCKLYYDIDCPAEYGLKFVNKLCRRIRDLSGQWLSRNGIKTVDDSDLPWMVTDASKKDVKLSRHIVQLPHYWFTNGVEISGMMCAWVKT